MVNYFCTYYVESVFIRFEKKTVKDIKIFPNSLSFGMGTMELSVLREQGSAVEVVSELNRIEYKFDKKVINVT